MSRDPRVLRGAATGLATARVALGVVALGAPEPLARLWVGQRTGSPAARVLGRALGARDLVLGLGALHALVTADDAATRWIAAGGAADVVDAIATFRAWRSLPRHGRLVVAGAAISGAFGSALLSACLGRLPGSESRP